MFREEYSPSAAEPYSCNDTNTVTRKKKNKTKRRFSDEQIRSLESMFETESRLEPRKKLQLSQDLGLHPRQVAIWFQNKRARWKSKQLERDYSILRSNYNSLASRFESLKQEKQALAIQLQKMNEVLKKQGDCCGQETGVSCSEGESNNGESNIKNNQEAKPCLSIERSEEDSSIKVEYLGLEEEANFMSIVEVCDGSLTSQEDWGSLDSDGLLYQSNSDCQWWDFWV